jgi:hypothetical protein
LSVPEVTRIQAEIGKPLDQHIKELTDKEDMKSLLDFLEKMVLNSYGQKTSDGKSFHKSKGLRDEFENSQAYAEVFEQLLMSPDLARKFGENVADNGKNKKNQVTPQAQTQVLTHCDFATTSENAAFAYPFVGVGGVAIPGFGFGF